MELESVGRGKESFPALLSVSQKKAGSLALLKFFAAIAACDKLPHKLDAH